MCEILSIEIRKVDGSMPEYIKAFDRGEYSVRSSAARGTRFTIKGCGSHEAMELLREADAKRSLIQFRGRDPRDGASTFEITGRLVAIKEPMPFEHTVVFVRA